MNDLPASDTKTAQEVRKSNRRIGVFLPVTDGRQTVAIFAAIEMLKKAPTSYNPEFVRWIQSLDAEHLKTLRVGLRSLSYSFRNSSGNLIAVE